MEYLRLRGNRIETEDLMHIPEHIKIDLSDYYVSLLLRFNRWNGLRQNDPEADAEQDI